eukprot:GHVT01030042.1.p1 GENE.GHVT01030042.1~~GHVT01030042.1.p1  ORF type:complete len:379 (+),score=78.02 GHVT01030042.1:20-1156(+)
MTFLPTRNSCFARLIFGFFSLGFGIHRMPDDGNCLFSSLADLLEHSKCRPSSSSSPTPSSPSSRGSGQGGSSAWPSPSSSLSSLSFPPEGRASTDAGPQLLRNLCVSSLKTMRSQFLPFYTGDVPYDEYVDSMQLPGKWAGHLELQAIAKTLNVHLLVVQLAMPSGSGVESSSKSFTANALQTAGTELELNVIEISPRYPADELAPCAVLAYHPRDEQEHYDAVWTLDSLVSDDPATTTTTTDAPTTDAPTTDATPAATTTDAVTTDATTATTTGIPVGAVVDVDASPLTAGAFPCSLADRLLCAKQKAASVPLVVCTSTRATHPPTPSQAPRPEVPAWVRELRGTPARACHRAGLLSLREVRKRLGSSTSAHMADAQ